MKTELTQFFKRLILLVIMCSAMVFNIMVQTPEANIKLKDFDITLDGDISEWASVPANEIAIVFQSETPNIELAQWKAVWDDEAIYILVEVNGDEWNPQHIA